MPQTERLFQEDSFCRRFTAQVVACEPYKSGWRAELSRTAFFPEGGGQPCDLGTLQPQNGPEAQVLDVQESKGRVLHTLDAPLPVGESITGEINWQRRRDAMEQHSGEHILSGLLHTLFGADNVGFHIGPDQVRMDMSVELSAAQLACAEEKANAIVRENVPVLVSVPSPEELSALTYRSKKELEGPVRIVEIPGADVCVFRHHTRDKRHLKKMKLVCDPVCRNGKKSRITQYDLVIIVCSRISVKKCRHICFDKLSYRWDLLKELITYFLCLILQLCF